MFILLKHLSPSRRIFIGSHSLRPSLVCRFDPSDIELNHVLRSYNEEAGELAKIALGRITVPPNVFARDVAKPSVNLGSSPSSQEEPSGAPSNPAGAGPMDQDPTNEEFVLSLLEGYGADEAEAMEAEPAPVRRTGRPNTLLG
jgi:hypothetical protein